jgi:hypothetical protein
MYRPDNLRVLFIGESRPAQGTFFYHENSHLYRYIKQAFEQASGAPFSCETFKQFGCWLYDVSGNPVNNIPRAERRKQIKGGLPSLEKVLKELEPEFVYVVKMGDSRAFVSPSIRQAGFIDGLTFFRLPFPANGHQHRFVRELVPVLKKTVFKG